MVRTAINLYSVRELDGTMDEILERVADAGYDGVQFSGGLRGADPGDVSAKTDDLGLDVTAAHIDIDDLEDDTEAAVRTYETVGADGGVVPWLGAEHFETRAAAEATAGRLDDLRATLADRGFDLHYHNHDHEFVEFDDTTGFEAFADASSVLLELDVGWVQTAGYDPVEVLRRYGDRVEVVHMKDMDTGVDRGFVEIGEGDVNVQACADAAREVDAEWLVYEHDDPDDPATSIETGAAVLADL
jgi:sugar phosphate isomerase/epimerase